MTGNKTAAIIGAGMAGLAAARRLCAKGVTVKSSETMKMHRNHPMEEHP